MSNKSSQKAIGRNRAPRVQIEYEVEVYGTPKKVQIPFVMGVMTDLSGDTRDALGPVRRGTQVQEQTLQEEERFEDVDHESGGAVLYDDQAGEGFADGPALPPEPDFIDEPRESFREPDSERSWAVT